MSTMGWAKRQGLIIGSGVLVSGCSGMQSALDPASTQAQQISNLWWLTCVVLSAVYVLVLAVLGVALIRGRRQRGGEPITFPERNRERRMRTVVVSGVAVTIVILFALLVSDFAVGRSMHGPTGSAPLQVKITGHQWWWEVQYQDPTPTKIVTTANEIHVPVGRPVQFDLRSTDVIHSFWAPNFNGKRDLIPGHPATLVITANRTGTFRGQCAEYCGAQHAHMRFVIVAEPPEKFERWLAAQRQPAPSPATDEQKKGLQVFTSSSCILCHTVQGTSARGTVGPNLTHIASRPRLAAGTLPNNVGHLGGWIVDPQQIKPGVHMPQNNLSPEELKALLAYLENLK